MKRQLKFLLIIITFLLLCTIRINAEEEYTVTPVNMLMYTNDNTVLCLDADLSTTQIPSTASELPINVIGITSNGFFETVIADEIWFIPANGLSTYMTRELEVYNIIVGQQSRYPTGMPFTNATFYQWNGGIYIGGYGCAAFAFELSDLAFGDAKARIHRDYSDIKIGDILRVYNNTHSVIVLEVYDNYVKVAEANYGGKVLWGRVLSMAEIQDSSSYIMTRY
jgi:hypothetical protein